MIYPLYGQGHLANSYLVCADGEAALVDPACDPAAVCELLARERLTLRYLLLTHVHYDHLIALYDAAAFADVPLVVHPADAPALSDPTRSVATLFGVPDSPPPRTLQTVEEGDTLPLGNTAIRVVHTPGHTPGSVCYALGDEFVTGDTLFADSIGTTRFAGGDDATLYASLARLVHLAPRHIYPGHGPDAAFTRVLSYNPFLRPFRTPDNL